MAYVSCLKLELQTGSQRRTAAGPGRGVMKLMGMDQPFQREYLLAKDPKKGSAS